MTVSRADVTTEAWIAINKKELPCASRIVRALGGRGSRRTVTKYLKEFYDTYFEDNDVQRAFYFEQYFDLTQENRKLKDRIVQLEGMVNKRDSLLEKENPLRYGF